MEDDLRTKDKQIDMLKKASDEMIDTIRKLQPLVEKQTTEVSGLKQANIMLQRQVRESQKLVEQMEDRL